MMPSRRRLGPACPPMARAFATQLALQQRNSGWRCHVSSVQRPWLVLVLLLLHNHCGAGPALVTAVSNSTTAVTDMVSVTPQATASAVAAGLDTECVAEHLSGFMEGCQSTQMLGPTSPFVRIAAINTMFDCSGSGGNKSVTILGPATVFMFSTQAWFQAYSAYLGGFNVVYQLVPFELWPSASVADARLGAAGHDANVMDSTVIGDMMQEDSLSDLTHIVPEDRPIDWSGVHALVKANLAMYNGTVRLIPLDFNILFMFYRTDLLAAANASIPRTWDELLALAKRLNGTDLDGDGRKEYGLCLEMAPGCRGSFLLLSIFASMTQANTSRGGLFMDPDTLEPLMASASMEAAMQMYEALAVYATPDNFSVATDGASCGRNSKAFARGSCAMTWSWFTQAKINSLTNASSEAATAFDGEYFHIAGKVVTAPMPGSTRILHRATKSMVNCTPALCPYATSLSLQDGSVAYVNTAPYVSGGISAGVNRYKMPQTQFAAYSIFSFFATGSNSWVYVSAPQLENTPFRYDHMDIQRWTEAGYNTADLQYAIDAWTASLNNPNLASGFRGRGSAQMRVDLLAAWHPVRAGVRTVQQAMAALRVSTDLLFPHATRASQYADYMMTLNLPALPPPPMVMHPPLPSPAPPKSKRDDNKEILGLKVGPATGIGASLIAMIIFAYLHKRHKWFKETMISAPGIGPATTLLITDIENSTTLWEALDAQVMDAALHIHHLCIRRLLIVHAGYESASEGDSFILAFHDPMAALQFSLQAQRELMEQAWPDSLQNQPSSCTVFTSTLSGAAKHMGVQAVITLNDRGLSFKVPKVRPSVASLAKLVDPSSQHHSLHAGGGLRSVADITQRSERSSRHSSMRSLMQGFQGVSKLSLPAAHYSGSRPRASLDLDSLGLSSRAASMNSNRGHRRISLLHGGSAYTRPTSLDNSNLSRLTALSGGDSRDSHEGSQGMAEDLMLASGRGSLDVLGAPLAPPSVPASARYVTRWDSQRSQTSLLRPADAARGGHLGVYNLAECGAFGSVQNALMYATHTSLSDVLAVTNESAARASLSTYASPCPPVTSRLAPIGCSRSRRSSVECPASPLSTSRGPSLDLLRNGPERIGLGSNGVHRATSQRPSSGTGGAGSKQQPQQGGQPTVELQLDNIGTAVAEIDELLGSFQLQSELVPRQESAAALHSGDAACQPSTLFSFKLEDDASEDDDIHVSMSAPHILFGASQALDASSHCSTRNTSAPVHHASSNRSLRHQDNGNIGLDTDSTIASPTQKQSTRRVPALSLSPTASSSNMAMSDTSTHPLAPSMMADRDPSKPQIQPMQQPVFQNLRDALRSVYLVTSTIDTPPLGPATSTSPTSAAFSSKLFAHQSSTLALAASGNGSVEQLARQTDSGAGSALRMQISSNSQSVRVSVGPASARSSLTTAQKPPSAAGLPRTLLFRGLRVRFGMHCGVSKASDITYNRSSARYVYNGEPLAMTRVVSDAANGGQVVLSAECHAQVLRQEKTGFGQGSSIPLMMYLGDYVLKSETAAPIALYGAVSKAHLPRLCHLPPLRCIRQAQQGVLEAPVGHVVVACMQVCNWHALQAWDPQEAQAMLTAILNFCYKQTVNHNGYMQQWPATGQVLALFNAADRALQWNCAVRHELAQHMWSEALTDSGLLQTASGGIVRKPSGLTQILSDSLGRGLEQQQQGSVGAGWVKARNLAKLSMMSQQVAPQPASESSMLRRRSLAQSDSGAAGHAAKGLVCRGPGIKIAMELGHVKLTIPLESGHLTPHGTCIKPTIALCNQLSAGQTVCSAALWTSAVDACNYSASRGNTPSVSMNGGQCVAEYRASQNIPLAAMRAVPWQRAGSKGVDIPGVGKAGVGAYFLLGG